MTHRRRCEGCVIGVAHIALSSGRDMRHRFGQGISRDITAVMAGRAVAHRAWPNRSGMAHGSRVESGVVFVACIALRRSRDMRYRLG